MPHAVPAPNAAHRAETLVLIADDDADMRRYIGTCLRRSGHAHVVEATDGDEAFALAQTLHPDLIVSDVVMPGLDGAALCFALKADARTRAIPFLLVSGETRTPPSSADGFLAKPFNAAGLRAEVARLLRSPPEPPDSPFPHSPNEALP